MLETIRMLLDFPSACHPMHDRRQVLFVCWWECRVGGGVRANIVSRTRNAHIIAVENGTWLLSLMGRGHDVSAAEKVPR